RFPPDFVRACRETRDFPDLGWTAKPYGMMFPRVIGRRLMVSEFDQMILDSLRTDAWQRPADLVRSNWQLIDLFNCFGDLFFIRRLRDWAGTGAVLLKEEPTGVCEFTASSFQLTAAGERLRQQGMDSASEAPEMWIGGCQLYGKRPWVRQK